MGRKVRDSTRYGQTHAAAAFAAAAALCVAGCRHPQRPPPLPAPEPVRIPAGCAADLSGDWELQADARFRYRGEDDGGALTLTVEREEADGGVLISLARTPHGFVGKTLATGFTSTGHPCPIGFPTEATSCPDGGLLLRAAATASINDECQAPQHGPPPPQVEHLLVRPIPPGGPGMDAGGGPDGGPVAYSVG